MSRYIDADKIQYRNGIVTRIAIEKFPTADVKPIVYGEWIIDKHNRVAQCSVCNKVSPYDYGDFCKWCGATMKESEEEE